MSLRYPGARRADYEEKNRHVTASGGFICDAFLHSTIEASWTRLRVCTLIRDRSSASSAATAMMTAPARTAGIEEQGGHVGDYPHVITH